MTYVLCLFLIVPLIITTVGVYGSQLANCFANSCTHVVLEFLFRIDLILIWLFAVMRIRIQLFTSRRIRIRLFKWMRARIWLLIKLNKWCENAITDPQTIHSYLVSYHCERSYDSILSLTAPKFWFRCRSISGFVSDAYPDTAYHSGSGFRADPEKQHWLV